MISVNINADTAIQLIVGVGSSVLALLLMLIKLPQSDYSSKLASSKHAIVVSFLLCAFLMFYTIGMYGSPDIWDWEMFTMLAIYVVVHFSTSIISFSMISLLKAETHRHRMFVPGLFVSAIIAVMLLGAYRSENMTYFWFMCIVALTAFLVQSVTYIVYFDKAYRHSLNELENYYDEDESDKIKWVRFCYIISMLTNIFILVYLCLYWFLDYKLYIAALYTVWYLVYMLYMTSNFISFLGSHKLVLDAFAHRTLSGQDIRQRREERKAAKSADSVSEVSLNEKEAVRLERALQKWVSEKNYRQYDKSREEIASDLKTSKEFLHHYFLNRLGVDFKTWRTQLRIEDAKKMLLEDKKISTNLVGEMCGFSDRSNFHRQFVKIVGCSPREWRESSGNPRK
jgi:AraC-like DNA-binding protein